MNKSEILWRGIWGMDIGDISAPVAGGTVLFQRNFDSNPETGPERLFRLNSALQEKWGRDCPIAIAIDQEGGTVSRLKTWVGQTPSFRQIWLGGGEDSCEKWGRLWGKGLSLLGISVNFAPVLDLHDGIEGTGMGTRCASPDPDDVCNAASAFIRGLESTGVRGCLKHFPGLGGTLVDSHIAMPSIDSPAAIANNILPFLSMSNPDRMVMVAHLKTPTSDGLPASLSKSHVKDNEWGVQGIWIPDDMEMGGCQAPGWRARARLAIEAGHIALLVCQTEDALREAAEAADFLDDSLVAPALEAFRTLRRTLKPMPERFDKEAWRSWMDEVRRAVEDNTISG
ncbi:MAG: hypothetical protein FWG12_07950 [Holophagaceae bacterium]|nr:hypothetical protein [Holophagaceae bacterium]